ncbi:hypothetical protein CRG98_050152, partial [Punica granatum]
ENRLRQFTSEQRTNTVTAYQAQTSKTGHCGGRGDSRRGRAGHVSQQSRGGRTGRGGNGYWQNGLGRGNNGPNQPHGYVGRGRDGQYNKNYSQNQTPGLVRSLNVNDRVLVSGPITVICQLCNSPGHFAIQCMQFYNYSISQKLPKSLAAMSLGDGPLETYMDSGAFSHMVVLKGVLQNPSSHFGSTKVILGEGVLLI